MGKQMVIDAYHGKKTERVPWVPYVGVHGAFLLGERADRYLQDPKLLAQGVLNAAERYKADGIPLCFDLQIEAMTMGCEARWWEDNPPAITVHILADRSLQEAGLKIPTARDGRWPAVVEAGKRVKQEIGDVALLGLLCGPITLGAHLRGVKLFTDIYKNPDMAKEVIDFAGRVGAESARIYAEIGCDVIAIVDPTASLVKPEMFRRFITPACQPALKVIHDAGLTSSYWS